MIWDLRSVPALDEYLAALSRPEKCIDGLIAQAIASAIRKLLHSLGQKRGQKWKIVIGISAEETAVRGPIILLLENEHYCVNELADFFLQVKQRRPPDAALKDKMEHKMEHVSLHRLFTMT